MLAPQRGLIATGKVKSNGPVTQSVPVRCLAIWGEANSRNCPALAASPAEPGESPNRLGRSCDDFWQENGIGSSQPVLLSLTNGLEALATQSAEAMLWA